MLVDAVGAVAAVLTTVCWVPQAVKILGDRDTSAISLTTTSTLALGVACWLVYGMALASWPIIAANAVTLLLVLLILGLKLRYG